MMDDLFKYFNLTGMRGYISISRYDIFPIGNFKIIRYNQNPPPYKLETQKNLGIMRVTDVRERL